MEDPDATPEPPVGFTNVNHETWKPPPPLDNAWEHLVMNVDTIEKDDKGELWAFLVWNEKNEDDRFNRSKAKLATCNKACPQRMLRFYEQHVYVFLSVFTHTSAPLSPPHNTEEYPTHTDIDFVRSGSSPVTRAIIPRRTGIQLPSHRFLTTSCAIRNSRQRKRTPPPPPCGFLRSWEGKTGIGDPRSAGQKQKYLVFGGGPVDPASSNMAFNVVWQGLSKAFSFRKGKICLLI